MATPMPKSVSFREKRKNVERANVYEYVSQSAYQNWLMGVVYECVY